MFRAQGNSLLLWLPNDVRLMTDNYTILLYLKSNLRFHFESETIGNLRNHRLLQNVTEDIFISLPGEHFQEILKTTFDIIATSSRVYITAKLTNFSKLERL